MQPPIFYNYENALTSPVTPSTIHVSNTALSRFFQRYLMSWAMSIFKWTAPDNWDLDYLRAVLFCRGYVAVVNTDLFGVIPQMCTLQGFNVYYRPVKVIIANPLIKNTLNPVIDEQCVLLRLQADYGGVYDLVTYYANMMALTAETAGVNILNSKLSYVFVAKNKATAESLKKLYDTIARGDPAAVIDTNLFEKGTNPNPLWQFVSQNVGQNYIADRLLSDLARLENEFKTVIGVPSFNTEKKERLITSEVEDNTKSALYRAADWLDRLQDGCRRVKAMFGVDVSVDWRFDPEEAAGDMAREDGDGDGVMNE